MLRNQWLAGRKSRPLLRSSQGKCKPVILDPFWAAVSQTTYFGKGNFWGVFLGGGGAFKKKKNVRKLSSWKRRDRRSDWAAEQRRVKWRSAARLRGRDGHQEEHFRTQCGADCVCLWVWHQTRASQPQWHRHWAPSGTHEYFTPADWKVCGEKVSSSISSLRCRCLHCSHWDIIQQLQQGRDAHTAQGNFPPHFLVTRSTLSRRSWMFGLTGVREGDFRS